MSIKFMINIIRYLQLIDTNESNNISMAELFELEYYYKRLRQNSFENK